jgi:hypothetical protein
MEKQVLQRLDRMITKYELALAKIGARRGVAHDNLLMRIERLETGLYALREGVHGFMKAKACGFPLENLDGYLNSIEAVSNEVEKALSDAIAKLEEFAKKAQPK